MKFVDYRVHDHYLPMYGYRFDNDTYWSMKYYEETWHPPMLFNQPYKKPA